MEIEKFRLMSWENARDRGTRRGRLGESGGVLKERLEAVRSPVDAFAVRLRMSVSTDNCCYRSGARVTGVRFVARIGVDDHHLGHVTADYRARFRYQA
jgi:hypothetical protein